LKDKISELTLVAQKLESQIDLFTLDEVKKQRDTVREELELEQDERRKLKCELEAILASHESLRQ